CIYHALNRGNAKNGKVRKLTPFPFYFPSPFISFTDCLEETLDEQSAFVQMEVKAAMIKLAGILQDNCNKARFKSGCCYQSKGRIKPRPKGKCPDNCIKLRAVCSLPPGNSPPPIGAPEF
ncbi:hypothetical protein, partial [Novipirellula herctigrandis]|uniref:hypothetical protein n=1 Tax=Novipirellula herctigrandis TaxID=2527986 RepID=UPI003AF3CD17